MARSNRSKTLGVHLHMKTLPASACEIDPSPGIEKETITQTFDFALNKPIVNYFNASTGKRIVPDMTRPSPNNDTTSSPKRP